MADEITAAEDVVVEENTNEIPPAGMTLKQMLLYKMDRTLAIIGIVLLGGMAMFVENVTSEALTVTTVCVGGLVTYVGGRVKK